jgi:hypothetical protein
MAARVDDNEPVRVRGQFLANAWSIELDAAA